MTPSDRGAVVLLVLIVMGFAALWTAMTLGRLDHLSGAIQHCGHLHTFVALRHCLTRVQP